MEWEFEGNMMCVCVCVCVCGGGGGGGGGDGTLLPGYRKVSGTYTGPL